MSLPMKSAVVQAETSPKAQSDCISRFQFGLQAASAWRV